jgi:hypothetical protein
MHSTISYNSDLNYLLVTIEGKIDSSGMRPTILDAGEYIKEHKCNRILGDYRTADLAVQIMELVDLYNFWTTHLRELGFSHYDAKRVILLAPGQKFVEKYRFFEDFTANRNGQVRLFYDFDEAVKWLCE